MGEQTSTAPYRIERPVITVPERKPRLHWLLSEELITEFCKLIEKGLPADGACDYLGITSTSYYTWLRRGNQFIDGDGQPEQDEMFGLFVSEFKKSTAKYRLSLVERLEAANGPNWIKYMATLERRDKKSYSRYDNEKSGEQAYDPDEKFL